MSRRVTLLIAALGLASGARGIAQGVPRSGGPTPGVPNPRNSPTRRSRTLDRNLRLKAA
jgi:hypothetical protein